MRLKFIMRREWEDEVILGLRYDQEKQEVLVGGSCVFLDRMTQIADLFHPGAALQVTRHAGSHRTKVRMLGVRAEDWERGFKELQDKQWDLRQTTTFRRLMG